MRLARVSGGACTRLFCLANVPMGQERRQVPRFEGLGEVIVEAGREISSAVLGEGIGGKRHDGRPPCAGARIVRVKRPNAACGTDAVTRVMIESADKEGERWTTLGVSPNIIGASYSALEDSYAWKLFRVGATPPSKA